MTAIRMPLLAFAVSISTLGIGGCASVPAETVELSHVIGSDLVELHRSHRALAELHFQGMRNDVDAFIDDIYRPALIEMTARDANFVENASRIINADPGRLPAYISRFLKVVDPKIEEKRRELLKPIEDQETTLLAEIDRAHGQVMSANSVVSGHLASIRSVHDAQSEALGRFGLADLRERIASTTSRLSDQVQELNARGTEISASIDDVSERVGDLDRAISNAFSPASEEVEQ